MKTTEKYRGSTTTAIFTIEIEAGEYGAFVGRMKTFAPASFRTDPGAEVMERDLGEIVHKDKDELLELCLDEIAAQAGPIRKCAKE